MKYKLERSEAERLLHAYPVSRSHPVSRIPCVAAGRRVPKARGFYRVKTRLPRAPKAPEQPKFSYSPPPKSALYEVYERSKVKVQGEGQGQEEKI